MQDIIAGLGFLVALYGAVVSTILAYREIRRSRRRIHVILEYIIRDERVQVLIVNVGHRPITIVNMLVEFAPKRKHEQEEKFSTYPGYGRDVFPLTLADGEIGIIRVDNRRLAEQVFKSTIDTKLTITDAEGRKYTKYALRAFDPKFGKYIEVS